GIVTFARRGSNAPVKQGSVDEAALLAADKRMRRGFARAVFKMRRLPARTNLSIHSQPVSGLKHATGGVPRAAAHPGRSRRPWLTRDQYLPLSLSLDPPGFAPFLDTREPVNVRLPGAACVSAADDLRAPGR